jgi:hypothetical protein
LSCKLKMFVWLVMKKSNMVMLMELVDIIIS